MTNDLKWMLSSDQQIPAHDPRMIDLWFSVMKWFKPDVVDYLGDTSDQACFSRFEDGKSKEFMSSLKGETIESLPKFVAEEERLVRDFYAQTRKMLPKAQLFSALGNHDVRVFDYVDKKMPDAIETITPEFMWGLDTYGYDYIYYNELPKRRFGDIHVHHGIAISQYSAESVKKDMDNLNVSLIRGHSHRAGAVFKTFEMHNTTLRGYEIGHMCDEKHPIMSYSQIHNWQKAFAIAHIVDDYPHIQLIMVSPDYECVVDGKVFKG